MRRERAISLMSRLTSIYTIYSLLFTTSGLGVRHTGPIGRLKPLAGRTVGITGKSLWPICKVPVSYRIAILQDKQ
jgi:hypothetical protein